VIRIVERVESSANEVCDGKLTLPFEQRSKSRLRAKLDDGQEAALWLPRGLVLRAGDRLRTDTGALIEVRAALELTSTARSTDALRFARACYHLGNRHVALEIGPGYLRYLHDHVLDDMVRQLGLEVSVETCAFEPEGGAYSHAGGHGHAHGQDHGHGHAHDHDH